MDIDTPRRSSARLIREQDEPVNPRIPYTPDPHSAILTNPVMDAALIAHLRHVFAPSVHQDHTLRDYDRMVGQQQVITYLATAAAEALAK